MSKPQPTFGAAYEYTVKTLGGPVLESDSIVSVANSRIIAVEGNGERVGLIFVNLGATNIFVNFDPAISTTNGIQLAPNGGNVTMTVVFDFTLQTRRWYAIADAVGPGNLLVIEYSRFKYEDK